MKTFKTFAEELEATLTRTIKNLIEANELKSLSHDELPHHDVLMKHGFKHTKTTTSSGKDHAGTYQKVYHHQYDHPSSGDRVTVHHYHDLENYDTMKGVTHAGTKHKYGSTHVGRNQTANWTYSPGGWEHDRSKWASPSNPHTGGMSHGQPNNLLTKKGKK